MSIIVAALVPALLAAAPAPRETITFESGACYGTCPVYRVTLDPKTGEGTFVGKKYTAVTGAQAFRATRAQAVRFRNAVNLVRGAPAGAFEMGGARCRSFATDLPTIRVAWTGRNARATMVYLGCDPQENRALFDALRRAPESLPIAAFIGERRNFPR